MGARPHALSTSTCVGFGTLFALSSVALVALPSEMGTRTKDRGSCKRLQDLPRINATCQAFGGCHGHCPDNPCQCTSQCINFGNCCPDFLHHCLKESEGQEKLVEEEEHLQAIEHGQGIQGSEWMLCMVMISFVLTMMALLCMVNSKRPGIQDAERLLTCTTVSIFAASTFSIALHGVLIEQLWMGKNPGLHRSAGPLVQAPLYGLLSLFFYTFSSCLVYWCRDSETQEEKPRSAVCHHCLRWVLGSDPHHWSFAIAQLSGHITAFLLIRAIGSLQQSVKASSLKCYLVLPWAAVLLRMKLYISKLVRSRYIAKEDVRWQWQQVNEDPGNDAQAWQDFDPAKSRRIEQQYQAQMTSEHEVYAPLVTEESHSTLTLTQPELGTCCMSEYWDLKETAETIAHHDGDSNKEPMSWASMRRFCKCNQEDAPEPSMLNSDGQAVQAIEWRVRRFCHWDHIAQEASVDGTALVMGFLILQLILYFHTGSLHPIEGLVVKPEDESLVSRMWVWSLGFGVLVAVVTGVEPHMMSLCTPTNFEFMRGTSSAAMGWCLLSTFALYARRSSTWMDTYISVAFPLTWLGFLMTGLIHCSIPRTGQEAAHVLHSVAQAFGIAVGLAWDKAFESVAVLSTQGWNGHYVVSKIVLASIVLVAVVPPWFWYLVPRAHGAHDAHCGQPSRKPPTEGAEALVIVKL